MPSTALACTLRRRFAPAARLAVLVGCGVAVAGCTGAVETFRSLAGHSRNDPDPVEAPFTGNLAAAETAPYPNLASVPPPPTRVTAAAERQRLTEKLIAEREAAQAVAGAPATATPTPEKAAAPAAASEPPPAAAAANAAVPPPASETPAAPTRLAAAAPPPVPAPAAAAGSGADTSRSATDAPDQALPRDSDLRMPQVRSLPEPDTHRPAPPPPRLRPVPPPAPPGQLPPVAIAGAAPQPAPSVPEFSPIAPPAPSLVKTDAPRAAATVAMVEALDSGQLDPAQITQVAARYKERIESQSPPRAVRVIAYTAAPAPGADPLGFYHDALERAQGIAKVLAEAGIPEKMIQSEAKPAPGPIAASRIEIQFLP